MLSENIMNINLITRVKIKLTSSYKFTKTSYCIGYTYYNLTKKNYCQQTRASMNNEMTVASGYTTDDTETININLE